MTSTKEKIRILTYHNVPNNGAVLQNYALQSTLQKELENYDVSTLDYIPYKISISEILKLIKPYKKSPLFNLKRAWVFRKFIYWDKNLKVDRKLPLLRTYNNMVKFLTKKNYKALVVGSDNIWKIREGRWTPQYPNIYWPKKEIKSKKYSFAASAYNSDLKLIEKNKQSIISTLEHFNLISVRDEFSYKFAKDIQQKTPVFKIPDPTFLMEIPKTKVLEKLNKLGIDMDKPTVAILIYGNDELSQNVYAYFKEKNFQVIALSMYNEYADYNLGHELDPFEWAEIFKYFKFVVTDRFHGTIFCLKNHTNFISIEPKPLKDYKSQSKIYSLLNDFNLTNHHLAVYAKDYSFDKFKTKYEEVTRKWNTAEVDTNLNKMRGICMEYINKMKKDLNENN